MLPSFNLYGLAISLALLMAYSFTAYRCSKRGLRTDLVWDSLPWVAFSGLIGARLYHVANYLTFYIEHLTLIPQVWRGGLGIYGAIFGGLFGAFLYLNFKSQMSNVKLYLNAAAPGIALGQAVGRVGNIFNRENLPFAWWEIVLNLTIFFTLLSLEEIQKSKIKRQNHNSKFKILCVDYTRHSFLLYLLLYSLGRFALEFFRTDSPWVVGPLTMAQWFSLVVIIIVLAVGLVGLRSRH